MRKVCHHECWLRSCETCRPDGKWCVYLTPTERVVCHHTQFLAECNNVPCCDTIDGSNVVIRDRNQLLYRIDGAPLKGTDRHDDMWACRLKNDPFSLGYFNQTALIIMDTWDKHADPGAALRVSQLAPAINEFANFLRARGCLIIHSPSDTRYYNVESSHISEAERTARQNAINARNQSPSFLGLGGSASDRVWARQTYFYLGKKDLAGTFNTIVEGAGSYWPSQSNPATGRTTKQNAAIIIHPEDAISGDNVDASPNSDAYEEILALTAGRPNLIYCGVHVNMCILNRTNGTRPMAKAGKSLWLVRDLTDALVGGSSSGFNQGASDMDVFVTPKNKYMNGSYNHFEATDLVVDWIGRNVGAETWTSDFLTGGQRFRFPLPFGDDPDRVWPRPVNQQGGTSKCCVLV